MPRTYRRHLVVLHGHGDDIQTDNRGDRQVEVLGGDDAVNEQPPGRVGGVVRLLPHLCW